MQTAACGLNAGLRVHKICKLLDTVFRLYYNMCLARRSLEGVKSSVAELTVIKEQMESAQSALRKVEASKTADIVANSDMESSR